jgi:kynurenine formamidase
MRIVVAALAALGAVSLAAPNPRAQATPSLDLRDARVVDLTHPFDEQTVYWPNAPHGFRLESLSHGRTPAGFFYAANVLCAPEHGGTHLDAPIHFAEGGHTADQVPIDRLVAPAVVLDVSAAAAADADHRLTVGEVEAWERQHGRIAEGTIVLLRTGWSERWPDRKRYLGDDTPGETTHLHFPSYGAAAAALLVKDRRVAALGVDTASIDHGPARDFPVHQLAAAANVPGLENVAASASCPPRAPGWPRCP